MPDIDVSDLLLDPDFTSLITVQRRDQFVGEDGVVVAQVVPFDDVVAVVLPQSDAPMLRGPDQQTLPRLIQVHTQFRLRGASQDPATGEDYQPDLIVWDRDTFVVNKVQNFSSYGAGFVQADASSVVQTAPPPQ